MRPEIRLHLIKEFCGVIVVKKCIMASSGSLLVFCSGYLWCLRPSCTFAQPAVQTARWS